MPGPIKLLKKGEVPSMTDTAKANEVITVVNAIATMQVVPAGVGKFTQQGDTAVLELAGSDPGLAGRVRLLELKVTQLIDSISNGTINANCDPNTSEINISMNFPNFPTNEYNVGNN